MPNVSRARGCMLGLAIGDALGAPLEGLTPQQIRGNYGVVSNYVDGALAWKRKPYRWRLPGLYTDDTQQALALAEVLLERGHVDVDRLAELYLALATPRGSYLGAHRGIGKSFRQVVADLERGVSPRLTGQTSAGIGAAMRIAPVAIYFDDDPEALFDSVLAASLMTHRDIRSLAGAMAVAFAVRRLLVGERRDASFLFRVAADVKAAETRIANLHGVAITSIERHRHAVSSSIARAERLLEEPRDGALVALTDEANQHGAEPTCRRPTMGFPPACIPTCLYLFLTTESFEDAVVEVVNLGGDADTAGAILGACAGAHYGESALPKRLKDGLQNRDGVVLRAEALALGDSSGLAIPDFVETERRLSELEEFCRDDLLAFRQDGDLGANRRR